MVYGMPDATDEQIWHALDVAQASDFVKEEGGLDATVEQDGDNFSGGQRQRLVIARLFEAPVYIFDDSFSALDLDRFLAARSGRMNRFKMGSRLSSPNGFHCCRRRLILSSMVGRSWVKAHDELKATNKTYQEILDSQLRREVVDA